MLRGLSGEPVFGDRGALCGSIVNSSRPAGRTALHTAGTLWLP